MILQHRSMPRMFRLVHTSIVLVIGVMLSACGGATTPSSSQPAANTTQPAAATEAAMAPTQMTTAMPEMTEMATAMPEMATAMPEMTEAATAATAAPTDAPAVATAAPTDAPAVATAALPAPASAGKSSITLYTTSDTNITDWLQNTVIPAFEAKYPQYEVQVIDAGDAGTDPIVKRAIAALQTNGDPQVELLEGDPRDAKDAVDADLWYKPTVADVPNLANVVPAARVTDLGAPYRGSQVLLAYNSEEVPENEVPKTYPDLLAWIKAHPGKFIYCRPDKGGSGGGFVNRAVYEASGDDPTIWVNPFNQSLVDQYYPKAIQLLQEIDPFVYGDGSYPAGNNPTLELFASGEVSMIPAWSDQALQGIARGTLPETTKLAQFTDLPMTGGYQQLSIPKNAANLQGAKDFLNFMLSSEQQVSVVRNIGGFPAVSLESLPTDLQEQFEGVITKTVPSWPGGDYGTTLSKMWYEKVATNIDPSK